GCPGAAAASAELWLKAKQHGFSDRQLAHLWQTNEKEIRRLRKEKGVIPSFKLVDTCAAEFEAYTPYYYSTYEAPARHLAAEEWPQKTQKDTKNEDTDKTPREQGAPDSSSTVFVPFRVFCGYSSEDETREAAGKDR